MNRTVIRSLSPSILSMAADNIVSIELLTARIFFCTSNLCIEERLWNFTACDEFFNAVRSDFGIFAYKFCLRHFCHRIAYIAFFFKVQQVVSCIAEVNRRCWCWCFHGRSLFDFLSGFIALSGLDVLVVNIAVGSTAVEMQLVLLTLIKGGSFFYVWRFHHFYPPLWRVRLQSWSNRQWWFGVHWGFNLMVITRRGN